MGPSRRFERGFTLLKNEYFKEDFNYFYLNVAITLCSQQLNAVVIVFKVAYHSILKAGYGQRYIKNQLYELLKT